MLQRSCVFPRCGKGRPPCHVERVWFLHTLCAIRPGRRITLTRSCLHPRCDRVRSPACPKQRLFFCRRCDKVRSSPHVVLCRSFFILCLRKYKAGTLRMSTQGRVAVPPWKRSDFCPHCIMPVIFHRVPKPNIRQGSCE